MKSWIAILDRFGFGWLTLVGVLVVAALLGVWLMEGLGGLAAALSPFNLLTWAALIVLIAPGVGALAWARHLRHGRR